MTLCFPCCRSLACCRQRAHLLTVTRPSRHPAGADGRGGGGGGDRECFIAARRRFTEPSTTPAGRTCHLQMDTYTPRRQSRAAADQITTAKVYVYHPPTLQSSNVVGGADSIGTAQGGSSEILLVERKTVQMTAEYIASEQFD